MRDLRPFVSAHLIRVRLDVLERLEDAERLVNGAPEAEVVDGGVLENALLVDDEEAAESDALVVQDLVVGAARGEEGGRANCVSVTATSSSFNTSSMAQCR